MDILNNAIAQLSELFRSMTPGARVTAGLLLAVVVVSLGYLFQMGTAGPDVYLFGGEALADSQLTRIEAAIAQANLSGHRREGNRIRVPAGQQAAYLAAVADGGALPPNFNTILETALDKGGPWESREATRQRLRIAKQQTLSEIVRAMYWVDDAVVLYDEQQPRGFNGTRQVTGSVNVKPSLGEALNPQRAKALQRLVAHAVVGLQPDNVAITNLGEGGSFGSDGTVFPESFDDDYYQRRVAYEQYKRQSILDALKYIPGVVVQVNAELDDTLEELTRTVKPDPKTAVRREVSTEERSTQTTSDGGGRPGTFAVGPNRQGAEAAARQQQSETSSETTEADHTVGMEERRLSRIGLIPKEVWATVAIPRSYVVDVWRQRNATADGEPTPEDLALIEDSIKTTVEEIVEPLLLGQLNKGEDTYKHVRIAFLDSLPMPTIESPSLASSAMAWTGRYWSTLAMLGVAMFSLLVLRSVIKGTPPGDGASTAAAAAPSLTLHSEPAEATGAGEDEQEPARPRLRLKKGVSLQDDLVEIVREDPDAAATILRSWIGKAG